MDVPYDAKKKTCDSYVAVNELKGAKNEYFNLEKTNR